MTEKRFELKMNDNGQVDIIDWVESKEKDAICIYNDLGVIPFSSANQLCELLNKLSEENEQLREALKNSYVNEICENCKYGHYWISGSYGFGLEGEFECTKKHFGNDHWKCDGLTECDDFELRLKGDDVE